MNASGNHPTTLLFFAVPEEARPFIRRWERTRGVPATRRHGPGLGAWTLAPDGVVVRVTGMGARNARRVGGEALAGHGGFTQVITAGFAGGLDPALRCGTVIFDAEPGVAGTDQWRAAGARPGRFVEVSRVAVHPADKARLRTESGADAVEMESSTLRSLARAQGIPSATVRVISDPADESLPLDFNGLMTPDDRIHFGRLAWAIARSPAALPRLLAFQRATAAAAQALARVLLSEAT